MTDELLTIEDAASSLGVSRASFLRAATEGGYVIEMGRRKRVWRSELREIVNSCRREPKALDCTGGRGRTAPEFGFSETPGSPSVRAGQTIAEKLKGFSRNTSPQNNAEPARVHQIK